MKRVMMTCMGAAFALSLVLVAGVHAEKPAHAYAGMKTCKMCHSKETTGDQFGIWEKSAHAQAYAVLGTDAAKAAAAKLGLEGNPQELGECLSCHTTAYGVDAAQIGKRFSVEDGVQCEACHGPGEDYKSMKIMKDPEAAKAHGLVVPTEKTCVTCHNDKSPTFKGFDYAEAWKKIAHPNPAK
jgi:hypothetical protein